MVPTEEVWETVGATRIWMMGPEGFAVCVISEPECEDSRDFKELDLSSHRWEEGMRRAKLITAAPDLLRELKHIVDLAGHLEKSVGLGIPGLATLNGARAAIAKAEGK